MSFELWVLRMAESEFPTTQNLHNPDNAMSKFRHALIAALMLAAATLSGCAGMISRATDQFSSDIEAAILDYIDPETVGQALPAYLLLLESRLESRPDDAALRLATARLTGAYAGLFAEKGERAGRLTSRALEHARIGVCSQWQKLCEIAHEHDFERLEALLVETEERHVRPAYVLATAWAGWINAHSDDYHALADLPRVEALLERLGELAPEHDSGGIWLYLGVLNSQRPPAAGGRPDVARSYFERAKSISAGRNLLVQVYMADSYARLVFDRELFHTLLTEVLETEPEHPGLTLLNLVARQRAGELLDQEGRIFD